MKTNHLILIFSFFLFTFTLTLVHAIAQIPPDRDELLKADDAGQAQYADVNGFPAPKHLLDLAKELQLSDAQKKSLQTIYVGMRSRALELGKRIIGIEEELHQAFQEGLVSEKSVRDDTEQIGKLRGRLRAVYLNANMKAKDVLTNAQIESYKKLRAAKRK